MDNQKPQKPFVCAWCKKPSTYDDDGEPTPDNMICDDCFEKEQAAQERDETHAEWYHEQQRIRYEGIHLFDNEVNRVSVVYHRKELARWEYFKPESNASLFDNDHRAAKLQAKGYIEGWCDAIAAIKKMQK